MALSNLTSAETEVVFQCLRCVAAGQIIPNDWEFQTLFGIEFETLQEIVRKLPAIDESQEDVMLAINNSMNNLIECARDPRWGAYISASHSEVARVFSKWRAEKVNSYFEGMQ